MIEVRSIGFPHSDISGSKVARHLPETYRSRATSFIASESQGIHRTPLRFLAGNVNRVRNGSPTAGYVMFVSCFANLLQTYNQSETDPTCFFFFFYPHTNFDIVACVSGFLSQPIDFQRSSPSLTDVFYATETPCQSWCTGLPAHLHTHKKTHSKVVLRDGMKLSTFSMKLLKIDEMRGAREERTEQ